MTGYTVHTGSTVKFSHGWDLIFQGSKSAQKSAAKPAKKSAAKAVKKTAKPATKKKAATKSAKRGK